MTTLRRLLIGVGAAALACSLASADTLYSTSALVTFTTDNSYTLTMDKFDSSLGTLTGATLYFYGAENVNVQLVNTSSTTQSFNLALQSNLVQNFSNSASSGDTYTGESLDLFDTGVGPGLATVPTPSGPITLGPTPGVACPAGTPSSSCNSVSYPTFTVQNIDPIYGFATGLSGSGIVNGVVRNIVGADLLNYQSPGAATFTLSGNTHSFFSGDGGGNNIQQNVTTTASFRAEIDYTYTVPGPPPSTPEPATMVLLGSALAGVGLLRKRIKG